jgi:hypothetical protein
MKKIIILAMGIIFLFVGNAAGDSMDGGEDSSGKYNNFKGTLTCTVYTENTIGLNYSFVGGQNVSLFRNGSSIFTLGSGEKSGVYKDTNLSKDTTYTYYLQDGRTHPVIVGRVQCKAQNNIFSGIYKAIEDKEKEEKAKREAQVIIDQKAHDKKVQKIVEEKENSEAKKDIEKILAENAELKIQNNHLKEQLLNLKDLLKRQAELLDFFKMFLGKLKLL